MLQRHTYILDVVYVWNCNFSIFDLQSHSVKMNMNMNTLYKKGNKSLDGWIPFTLLYCHLVIYKTHHLQYINFLFKIKIRIMTDYTSLKTETLQTTHSCQMNIFYSF